LKSKTRSPCIAFVCDTLERARHWIDTLAPLYVARGYFSDKTLTPDSFIIIEA
jgi:hypothetical protein